MDYQLGPGPLQVDQNEINNELNSKIAGLGLTRIDFPYDPQYQNNIPAMLNNAIATGRFPQDSTLFVGSINPAGRGAIYGFVYYTNGYYYGCAIVAVTGYSGFYNCVESVWSAPT